MKIYHIAHVIVPSYPFIKIAAVRTAVRPVSSVNADFFQKLTQKTKVFKTSIDIHLKSVFRHTERGKGRG